MHDTHQHDAAKLTGDAATALGIEAMLEAKLMPEFALGHLCEAASLELLAEGYIASLHLLRVRSAIESTFDVSQALMSTLKDFCAT